MYIAMNIKGRARENPLLIVGTSLQVLDLGCGTGGAAFYLATHYGVDVHGFDVSPTMIAIANDYKRNPDICPVNLRHKLMFETRQMDEINYRDNYYDVIIRYST